MKFLTNLLMIVVIAIAIFVLVVLPWPALVALVVLLALWMAFTRTGRQAWSVTNVGIATIPQRLGSSSVILSRTFHRADSDEVFEQQVAALREAEAQLARRSAAEVEADRVRIAVRIDEIAKQ